MTHSNSRQAGMGPGIKTTLVWPLPWIPDMCSKLGYAPRPLYNHLLHMHTASYWPIVMKTLHTAQVHIIETKKKAKQKILSHVGYIAQWASPFSAPCQRNVAAFSNWKGIHGGKCKWQRPHEKELTLWSSWLMSTEHIQGKFPGKTMHTVLCRAHRYTSWKRVNQWLVLKGTSDWSPRPNTVNRYATTRCKYYC